MGAYLLLNDEAIALKPGSSLSWNLAYGLEPHISTLETTWVSAARIAKMASVKFPEKATGKLRTQQRRSLQDKPEGPLTLSMGDTDNGRAVEIKGVYVVVSNRPGTDYNTRTLVLADQRWFWGRTFIERSYNLRRKTGEFRLVRNEMAKIQNNRLRADFGYRRATLFQQERPWTALEVLEDVLTEICGPTGFVIDNPESLTLQDTIEGLELHDPGPQALGRILNSIPGARIFIGEDGKAHVASIYDGTERAVFEALPEGYAGDWQVIDKSAMRPASYRIYFDREVELRFDHVEERSTQVDLLQTQVRDKNIPNQPAQEPMWLENVIINPLFSLQLDPNGDKFATMGEPVPLDQFIDACNLHIFNPVGQERFEPAVPGFKLTKDAIRRNWLGNWSNFIFHFAVNSQLVLNPERTKLLSAIRRDYRQTYRILPQWRDKIRALINNRAAILDYENGTRAPGSVFTSYITKFSQLGYLPYVQGKTAVNTDDYADDLTDKSMSPFSISIEDNDMGILRIAATLDQTGTAETYMIGSTKDGTLPSAKKSAAVLTWNTIYLDEGFKLAVILTAVQDTPNNTGRLHKEEVLTTEAAVKLAVDPGVCQGPVVELAVDSDTARFAWIDSLGFDIRNAFFKGEEYPEGLMVNPEEIRGLAVSAATQDLVRHLDKVEGRVTGPLRSQLPTGNLRTVTHVCAVGAGGRAVLTTTLAASGELPVPQINSLLEEGTRRKVRRLVQP